ncbi:MAG: peptidoglycan DD-metalloendopeptidase family protein [Actinobacteria bacterium]|nr:peptidoglycan DD-metalloendopeptidase family protein [Actinomycetota bacterium]
MSRFHRTAGLATAVAVLLSLVAPPADASAQARAVSYVPPLDAPVVDGFRPPASQFAAGNRGVDYAAEPGDPVRAAAAGQVVFAGRIGSDFHVVVLHADGVRTSYSFMQSGAVRRGDRVDQGDVVGTAGGRVHFGARAGSAYLDPTDLFAGEGPAIRLVPVERLPSEAEERNGLIRALAWVGRGAAAAAQWGAGQVQAAVEQISEIPGRLGDVDRWLHYAQTLLPPAMAVRLTIEVARASGEWEAHRENCTARHALPPRLDRRQIAVLVPGLGSSSSGVARGGGVGGVDTVDLGFASRDTYVFSYQGGHIRQRGYGPEDTHQDLRESGRRLAALLRDLERENPGVPIVLIAHSQGGLVSREALRRGGTGSAAVQHLITLATPHQGSDVATAGAHIAATTTGRATADHFGSSLAGIPPDSQAVQQLSETSEFIRSLPAPPSHVEVTSIAARGDFVVPVPRTRLPGADQRVVAPDTGFDDHNALPSDGEARREMALALAGLPATCRSLEVFVADRVAGHLIGQGVDAAGVAGRLVAELAGG